MKTTALNDEQLYKTKSYFKDIVQATLSKDSSKIIPKINNIEHWFIDENINDLGKMLYVLSSLMM